MLCGTSIFYCPAVGIFSKVAAYTIENDGAELEAEEAPCAKGLPAVTHSGK